MMEKNLKGESAAIIMIMLFGVLSRFLPHLPNMTAVGAMVIFSGAQLRPRWLGVLLPGFLVFISDLLLGYHSTIWFTLGAWIFLAYCSGSFLRSFSWGKLGGMSLATSIVFFLVSNFGFWATGYYGSSLWGLAQSYVAALPFLGQELLGDLIYSGGVFAFWLYLVKPFLLPRLLPRSLRNS